MSALDITSAESPLNLLSTLTGLLTGGLPALPALPATPDLDGLLPATPALPELGTVTDLLGGLVPAEPGFSISAESPLGEATVTGSMDMPSLPALPALPALPGLDLPALPGSDLPGPLLATGVSVLESILALATGGLPELPGLPALPELPAFGKVTTQAEAPSLPELPGFGDLPALPGLDSIPDLLSGGVPLLDTLGPLLETGQSVVASLLQLASGGLPELPGVPSFDSLPDASTLTTLLPLSTLTDATGGLPLPTGLLPV